MGTIAIIRNGLVAALVLAAASSASSAAPALAPGQFPGVADTSFVAANGERTQRLSIEVPASPREVWLLLSTSEGWMRWSVKTAYVDFREGGLIETSYRAGAAKGDRDNIQNLIVAIAPERLLAFRNVQAPRDFKDPELFSRVTTVISIEPLGRKRSRVTVFGDGYGAGAGFDELYGRFLTGNAYTLVKLHEALAKGR